MSAKSAKSSRSTTAKKSAAKKPPPQATDGAPTSGWKDDPDKREAMIRLVAYSFYERRGCIDGHELEDWLQAEMEVQRRLEPPAAPAEAQTAIDIAAAPRRPHQRAKSTRA